ncbi:MAG: polysaccharide biosynthesis/export family protein [Pseudomonadota bacterium]
MAGSMGGVRTRERRVSGRWALCAGVFMALAMLCLSACSNSRFPVTTPGQADLPDRDITVVRITSETIDAHRTPARTPATLAGRSPPPEVGRYTYRVGAGDTLKITFFADPAGITEPGAVAPTTDAVIDEAGTFFYPFIGSMRAEGRTVGEIRTDLTTALGDFFATPQVEVTVQDYNARRVTVAGAVEAPGRRTLTNVSTTLVDLVNEAGAQPQADLSRIDIRRGGQAYTVNLRAFLEEGAARHNPVMLPNDFVRVPVAADNKIFTFGEIATGEVELSSARKTLLEVLAEQGGIDRLRADARGIFVFRRDDPTRSGFDVYQFDLTNAAALVLAADFGMAPLDIVFVTNDPATRWNDTLNKIVDPFDSLIDARTTARVLGDD